MSGEVLTTGKCLCGSVSYSVQGDPVRMAHCHCRDCQRASGAGHMSLAFFKADQVDFQGETKAFAVTADSGNVVTRHFCPTCGSRISTQNSARPGLVGLPVGLMEERDWFAPQAVVFTKNCSGWDATPTDIPNFEAAAPAACPCPTHGTLL